MGWKLSGYVRIKKNWKFFFLIYLFMAVLGLRFCARTFSSCGKRGPLFIAVRGPLTVVASLVAEHRLQTRRLSNCGSWAQLLRGMWDLPRPGLEPVSPELAGRFSTTAPPGKPWKYFLKYNKSFEYLNSVGTSYTVIFTYRSKKIIKHIHERNLPFQLVYYLTMGTLLGWFNLIHKME